MKKRLFIALVIILVLIPTSVALAKNPLRVETTYSFAGHLGIFDGEGRLLGWKGTTSGDIEGVIRWWMVLPMPKTGQVSHFVDRWEIWDATDTVLLLAGDEAGTTTDRPGKTGVWRANGTVTYVNPDFPELADWFGRQVHDGGEFEWFIPGVLPLSGWGTFRIN